MAANMTFTMRPMTIGEGELAYKSSHGDVSAMVDLIVSRSEPKVTREYVCSLDISTDLPDIMLSLAASFATMQSLRKLFGSSDDSNS